jgi:hypothetical protein
MKCVFLFDLEKKKNHVKLVLMFLVFGVCTVWYDIYTDFAVFFDFLYKRDFHWAGWTLALIFTPFVAHLLEFLIWKAKHFKRIRNPPKEKRSFAQVFWTLPPFHMLKYSHLKFDCYLNLTQN